MDKNINNYKIVNNSKIIDLGNRKEFMIDCNISELLMALKSKQLEVENIINYLEKILIESSRELAIQREVSSELSKKLRDYLNNDNNSINSEK